MKIPLLSGRLQNKRFQFEPRYYDPVKEDIDNRTARIAAEMKHEPSAEVQRARIKTAYIVRENRSRSIDMMQVVLMVLLVATVFGWIYYGNVALYFFLVLFPIYIYFRTRKHFR